MSKRRVLVSALHAGALALAMTVAGLQGASAARAEPATASDPTPTCAGRGETFGQVLNLGDTVYYTVGLNECDTLRLRNWLAAGAATGGTCSAITKCSHHWVIASPFSGFSA